MAVGSLFGLVLGIGMVIFGIAVGGVGFSYYIHVPSVLIVLGGSLGAIMVSSPMNKILAFGQYVRVAMSIPDLKEDRNIINLVIFAERARREGLLALEDNLDDVDNEFMRKGIQLVVDGTDPDIIKNILYTELNQIQERHRDGINLFGFWGSLTPAFGMVGTLIGLIAMLANLDNSAGIAQGMATALITTLYGTLMANLVLVPMKHKLIHRDKYEARSKEIVIEGILSIQAGDNPRILLEKLLSFLPPQDREPIRVESNQ